MNRRLSRHALARIGQAAGLQTLQERADKLGISKSHLNKIERGEIRCSAPVADAMSLAYRKSIEDIFRHSRNAVRTLRQLQLDAMQDES